MRPKPVSDLAHNTAIAPRKPITPMIAGIWVAAANPDETLAVVAEPVIDEDPPEVVLVPLRVVDVAPEVAEPVWLPPVVVVPLGGSVVTTVLPPSVLVTT